MMFESMEMLLIMLSPALISFKLIQEALPQQILPIIIPITAVLFLWYVVMLLLISTPKNIKDSTPAFIITSLLYWGFLAMLVPFIELGAKVDP